MNKIILTAILASVLTFISISILFFYPSKNISVGEKIVFRSENGEFEFTTIPSTGRDFKMMEKAFSAYKLESGIDEGMKIIRVTRKNYLNISKWCAYKTQMEWQYPLIK